MRDIDQIDKIIGANVRLRRSAAGMTQKALGEACFDSLSCQQISEYELGNNQISSSRLVDFARVLKCPVADLFDGVSEMLPPKERITRGAHAMMKDYQAAPESIQDSVRILLRAMILELAGKRGA